MADLIQMPKHILNARISDMENDISNAEIFLKKFKETRELGFLITLIKIISTFDGQWFYLIGTILDTEQKNKLEDLVKKRNNIESFVMLDINKLGKCKV